jgi:hypothetical protein
VVDWYYIFPILPLGVYPRSPDIYNVHKIINFYFYNDLFPYRERRILIPPVFILLG